MTTFPVKDILVTTLSGLAKRVTQRFFMYRFLCISFIYRHELHSKDRQSF